jgi:hypothetical protein
MVEKTLEEQLEDESLVVWFCPQINARCNKECYCYIPAKIIEGRVVNGTAEPARIQKAFCIHAMHQEQLEVNAIVQL